MATLSSNTRRKLKHLHMNGSAQRNINQLACWNWALSGFGLNAVNPDTAFSYVAGYMGQGDLLPQFQQPNRLNRLDALRNQWQPYVGARAATVGSTRAFQAVTEGIVKLAIEVNGLRWSANQTPYEICMYYSEGLDHDGDLVAPNYTHWWLRIDGGGTHNDGIEAFPGSQYITIRRPEYSSHHVCRVYVQALHATHVQTIDATLQDVIRTNHNAVLHGPWAPVGNGSSCSICNVVFNLLTRNHHCRCCGRLVCASCSPGSRGGVAQVQHPNGRDGQGPQRVCLYCE